MVGVPVVVALLWALITPAGLIGSLAGVCIVGGVIIVFIGIGFAGDIDTAAERMLPGANLEQMGQDRPRRSGRKRWAGLRTIGLGLAYVVVGAFFYALR